MEKSAVFCKYLQQAMEREMDPSLSLLENWLPSELIREVLANCSVESLGRLAQTSKKYHRLSSDNFVWERIHPDPQNKEGKVKLPPTQVKEAKYQVGYVKYLYKVYLGVESPEKCPSCVARNFPSSWIPNPICRSCYQNCGLMHKIELESAKPTYSLTDADLALLPDRWIREKKGVKWISEFFVRRLGILKFGSLKALKAHLSTQGVELGPSPANPAVRHKRKRDEDEEEFEAAQKLAEEDSNVRRSSRLAKRPKTHYQEPTEADLMADLEELLPSIPMEL